MASATHKFASGRIEGYFTQDERGAYEAIVSNLEYLSTAEVRGHLSSVLAIDPEKLTFKLIDPGESLSPASLNKPLEAHSEGVFQMAKFSGVSGAQLEDVLREMVSGEAVISATDSIRDLDGDSLFCLQLSEVLADRYGIEIEPLELYRCRSLADIAQRFPTA